MVVMNVDENKSEDPDQEQQHGTDSSLPKPELTAEWTVRAQLTISRPGAPNSTRQTDADDQPHRGGNPVHVVYKWSSDDIKATDQQDPNKTESPLKGQHESFHSTTGGNKPYSDSGFSFSGSNTSRKHISSGGTRCRSTCSIVLSAVADFLPTTSDIPEETDPLFFNTTASYTVSPEKASEDVNASKNFGVSKILALRDAYSQTSDTETRKLDSRNFPSVISHDSIDKKDGRKRKHYDYRRSDPAIPSQVDEGNSYLPSYAKISPANTFVSSPIPHPVLTPVPVPGSVRSEKQKPPRTVHIDVYCTGSDGEDGDDDDGDDEQDSSSPSAENIIELESNSTPQTVLDNEQMLLRHQRATKIALPRRYTGGQQSTRVHQQSHVEAMAPLPTEKDLSFPNIGHAITKSSTADEINESKHLLFKKHIGDRSRFNFKSRLVKKDPSDDCLSSNYPNSSRSTMRDMTCSSISSAVQSNVFEDVESSWKETEPDLTGSLAKSDSFEYDNSIDRVRIKKMDRMWSLPEREQPDYQEGKFSPSDARRRYQELLKNYRVPNEIMKQYFDTLHSDNFLSETEHNYLFGNTVIPEKDEPPEVPMAFSNSTPSLTQLNREAESPDRPTRTLFTLNYAKSGSEASTMQSNLSGYTTEYLTKARKFGSVVTALRKPGHHIGPAKNPECQCEHCRRWVAERTGGGRGRTLSVGDTPTTRGEFWLKRAGLN